MQLCLKETLKDWLRANQERCHATVLDYFAQIVDAVHFLHNQGLIHRDLKPSNIFFASDRTVKIGVSIEAIMVSMPFLWLRHLVGHSSVLVYCVMCRRTGLAVSL